MKEFVEDVLIGVFLCGAVAMAGRVVAQLTGRSWDDGTLIVVGGVLVGGLLAFAGLIVRWWREFRR